MDCVRLTSAINSGWSGVCREPRGVARGQKGADTRMVEDLEGRQDVDPFAPAPEEDRTFQHVQLDTQSGIVRITLNRAPANVLSVEMMQEIGVALDSLEFQRDVKLVVLNATGKYFSAGFELSDHLGDRAYMMLESFRRIFEGMSKVDKPTLAVIAGPALGAGCLLAAACDITLAGESVKLGHPEIRGGVFNTMAAALPELKARRGGQAGS